MIPPTLERHIRQQISDTRTQATLSWVAAREAEDKKNERHQTHERQHPSSHLHNHHLHEKGRAANHPLACDKRPPLPFE